jgi:hypothetical protein
MIFSFLLVPREEEIWVVQVASLWEGERVIEHNNKQPA